MIGYSILSILLEYILFASFIIIILWLIYNIYISLHGLKFHPSNKNVLNKYDPVKISIIIPAKDEESVLNRLLDSILKQDYPHDKIEVIIVDGASRDRTYDIARNYMERYKIFKVIREDYPRGKPHALNIGLKHVSGDVVGVFDADSIIPPDLLRRVSKIFNDDNVIAIQGKPISVNEDQNLITKLTSVEEKIWYNLIMRGREKLNLFIPITGSCFFIRRNVLEEVGGFNEDELAEDLELSLRLLKHGYIVKYIDEAYAYQESPSTLKALISQRTRWYRGYVKNFLRYGSLIKLGNLKSIDVEILLSGPIILSLSLFTYLSIFLGLLIPSIYQYAYPFAITINILTLISMTLYLLLNRPITFRKILLAISIYFYWILEAVIALKSVFLELFRRPYKWIKTEKTGVKTLGDNIISSG